MPSRVPFRLWQLVHPRWLCAYRHTRHWVVVGKGVVCNQCGHVYWGVS